MVSEPRSSFRAEHHDEVTFAGHVSLETLPLIKVKLKPIFAIDILQSRTCSKISTQTKGVRYYITIVNEKAAVVNAWNDLNGANLRKFDVK